MSKEVKKQTASQTYSEQVAQKIIDALEAGTAPWQKPWKAGVLRAEPQNPISGTVYSGMNVLNLEMEGHDDPRWMTYKQAKAAGYQVRKGEKATKIEYWQWSKEEKVLDANGKPQKDAEGKDVTRSVRLSQPKFFPANVFNAEQIDGIEPYVAPELPADGFEPHIEAEKILASLDVKIQHNQSDRAFYLGGIVDEIRMPPKGQFESKEAYYATALHELGHATGHESRLNRDISGGFGSANYAKEELRAEIASFMLTTKLGLGHDPAPHAVYVKSWVKALQNDHRAIFQAARDADKIQKYLTEPELRQNLEQKAEKATAQKSQASFTTPTRTEGSGKGDRPSAQMRRPRGGVVQSTITVSDKEKSNISLQNDKNFSFGKNLNKEKDTETMQNRMYIFALFRYPFLY